METLPSHPIGYGGMLAYLIPLADRIAKGNLPEAYDLYNDADVNGILPSITATGYLCPGRAGHTLVFEDCSVNDFLGHIGGGYR